MTQNGRKSLLSASAIMCAVTTLSCTSGLAQGLPYEARPYVPEQASTVIAPTSGDAEESARGAVEELGSVVQGLPEPIWTETARNFLDTQVFGYSATTMSPENERPQTFVEVNEIAEEGAAWLQLRFRKVDLGDARLVVSSPNSGRSQSFTGTQLQEQAGQTVLFPGDRLRVQMQVQGGTALPPLDSLIEQVIVGESFIPAKPYPEEAPEETPEQQASNDEEARCGIADSRTFSQEAIIGRMFPAGCTAFILEGGIYASAGHCFREGRELQNVEFNVPRSSSTGTPQTAAVTDTYPVIADSIICSDCIAGPGQNLPHGQDWAVFLLGRNTETGLEATGAQGDGFRLAPDLTVGGRVVTQVRIDGFGWDDEPSTAQYAAQTARGRLLGLITEGSDRAELGHLVDTEQGGSGSPMVALDENGLSTAFVVGIHTGGRCNRGEDDPNKGTAFSHQGLLEAVDTLRERRIAER